MKFRPSLLPKLAACPKYESKEFAGEAADRGTVMDALFRGIIAQGDESASQYLDQDAIDAVGWAINTAVLLSGDHPLEANEDALRIKAEGMDGTADVLCEGRQWSGDLKSGAVRNYDQQQACYALGFMDRFWLDEWTVYLLFCDARQVVTIHYTRDEAERIIRDVKAKALDPIAVATPCEYCGWCARQWKCPQRLETVAWFLKEDPDTLDLSDETIDPDKLGKVMLLTFEIAREGGVHDTLRAAAKNIVIEQKRPVPGWRVQNGKETRSVSALMLQQPFKGGQTILNLAGTQQCMAACGTITEAKFQALWITAFGQDPIPPGTVTVNHGAPFLIKERAKKTNSAP